MLKCCFSAAAESINEPITNGNMQAPDKASRDAVLVSSPNPGPEKHMAPPQASSSVSKTPIVTTRSTSAPEGAIAELGSDVNSILLSEAGPARPSHPLLHDSHHSHRSQQPCSPCSTKLPPWLSSGSAANSNSTSLPQWTLDNNCHPPQDSGENASNSAANITHNTVSEILRAHLSEVRTWWFVLQSCRLLVRPFPPVLEMPSMLSAVVSCMDLFTTTLDVVAFSSLIQHVCHQNMWSTRVKSWLFPSHDQPNHVTPLDQNRFLKS